MKIFKFIFVLLFVNYLYADDLTNKIKSVKKPQNLIISKDNVKYDKNGKIALITVNKFISDNQPYHYRYFYDDKQLYKQVFGCKAGMEAIGYLDSSNVYYATNKCVDEINKDNFKTKTGDLISSEIFKIYGDEISFETLSKVPAQIKAQTNSDWTYSKVEFKANVLLKYELESENQKILWIDENNFNINGKTAEMLKTATGKEKKELEILRDNYKALAENKKNASIARMTDILREMELLKK